MKVFGHEQIIRTLEVELPPVSLFRGPPSVGKWTVAEYLAEFHGVKPVDLRRIEKLDAEAARDLKQFAFTAPFGKYKLVIIQIDKASEASMNSLLKLLEEPPPSIRFILICVTPPLDTIMSRSHVFRFGVLHRDDVFDILVNKVGMAPGVADRAADLGRGQVQAALLSEQNDVSRASVLSLLKAIADGDQSLLEQAANKWDDVSHDLLIHWCIEAITGRWQVFSASETFGLTQDKKWPRMILLSLRSGARPKLVVRTMLRPLLEQRRRAA